MGVVYSNLIRRVRRINAENRALRHIEKSEPVSAPKHPSSRKFINEVIEATPDIKDELLKKNIELDKYLKDVYVTSKDKTPDIKRDSSLLPQNRNPLEDDELGFWEPPVVPEGYCSLRQALKFLADHQGDPTLWTAAAIAKEYKLDEKKVEHILEHYKTFNVYIPAVKQDLKGMYSSERILYNVKKLLNKPKEEPSEAKSINESKNGT